MIVRQQQTPYLGQKVRLPSGAQLEVHRVENGAVYLNRTDDKPLPGNGGLKLLVMDVATFKKQAALSPIYDDNLTEAQAIALRIVHEAVEAKTHKALKELAAFRRKAGLDDQFTKHLEGLIWAREENRKTDV